MLSEQAKAGAIQAAATLTAAWAHAQDEYWKPQSVMALLPDFVEALELVMAGINQMVYARRD